MKKKILVIEDDLTAGRLLSSLLPEYEVSIEQSGLRAAEAALEFRPDVILQDLVMPGAYGLEVATQLQSDPQLAGIPIIVVSGFVEPNGESPSEVAGFAAFSKPINIPALKKYIESIFVPVISE